MNASVNLVPQACRIARQRIVRRNRWGAVSLTCALAAASGAFVRYSSSAALEQAGARLTHLQARQADLDRQLAVHLRSRAALLDRARSLSTLRQSLSVPEQLVALAAAAPNGVVLTELRAEAAPPPATAKPPPPATSAQPRAARAASQPIATPTRRIGLNGLALDHERLTQLMESIRRVPLWQNVELLRAAREPLPGGHAIAFRLECQERSAPP
jgi:Tfp pilus assembly protein PilN